MVSLIDIAMVISLSYVEILKSLKMFRNRRNNKLVYHVKKTADNCKIKRYKNVGC